VQRLGAAAQSRAACGEQQQSMNMTSAAVPSSTTAHCVDHVEDDELCLDTAHKHVNRDGLAQKQ